VACAKVFDDFEISGGFVAVNALYGVKYGTPLAGIIDPLKEGKIPILDYPIQTVGKLRRPEYDLLSIYVYPSSTDELTRRSQSNGRDTNVRLEAGLDELEMLAGQNCTHPDIDISVVNADGGVDQAVTKIASALKSIIVAQ
jgi:guanylate kinase